MYLHPERRYETLLRINNAIVQKTSREQLFRACADELRKLFHFDRCSINLYDQDTKSLSYFATAEGVPLGGDTARPLEKGSIAQMVIRSRKPLVIPDVTNQSYFVNLDTMRDAGLRTTMAFPLVVRDVVLGSLHFSFVERPENLDEIVDFLDDLSPQVAIAVDNMLNHIRLQTINENLQSQKSYLRKQADQQYDPEKFYYSSDSMLDVMSQVRMVAATDASVLITGETGTGKECVAHCIHEMSARNAALMVKVNCPALAASLFESELFGHAKGAFTGAAAKRLGRFEMAQGGTVFLDEIGDLPMPQQAKLLTVLQDGQLERVGESKPISVDFRVVSATNKDLEGAIVEGDFRSDLYYRLNTMRIHIPALRERPDDVPVLIHRLTSLYMEQFHKPGPVYTDEVMDRLMRYAWPGNVREVKNMVQRMLLLRSGERVLLSDVEGFLGRGNGQGPEGRFQTMEEMECEHLKRALAATKGVVGGAGGAADILGMPRTTLQYRLSRHGLRASDFR
ncbi:sigma-54-dependent Fis family transcriptional regulator [Desulfocurvus sp. DL9XJH121]